LGELSLMAAWTNVHAAQEEIKRMRDNEFRAEHPHLSEWKEVAIGVWTLLMI
jgi:hypothetical protein